MPHHKRRRPKHQRAGCLLCKPHKDERETTTPPVSVARRLQPSRPGFDDLDPDEDGCDGCEFCAPWLFGVDPDLLLMLDDKPVRTRLGDVLGADLTSSLDGLR